ncbi:hypothetical protein KC963_00125 [Candidatus Saccharibacteria bacterium]|nr:hypothetical protein [Candidatus Saccharibacteria bacterium]
MATSGKQFLSATAADIIKEALQLVGVLAEGESVNATTEADCIRSLNYMVKHWQGKHMGNLWAIEPLVLFLKKDQREYTISATSTDYFCKHSDLIITHVQTAAAASDTSIVLDSVTGISDNDKIGIQTTNNVVEWFDVSGSPSGNTVSFDGGTGSLQAAAAVDNIVYVYTPVAATYARPLQIIDAVLRNKSTASDNLIGYDTPVQIIAREDFNDLAVKTTTGRVNQIYFNPELLTAKIQVWPTTNDETEYLVMWVRREIEFFDANSQDVDYPQEWYQALAWNLAMLVAPKWGMVDKEKFGVISAFATQFLEEAASNDTEHYLLLRPNNE